MSILLSRKVFETRPSLSLMEDLQDTKVTRGWCYLVAFSEKCLRENMLDSTTHVGNVQAIYGYHAMHPMKDNDLNFE